MPRGEGEGGEGGGGGGGGGGEGGEGGDGTYARVLPAERLVVKQRCVAQLYDAVPNLPPHTLPLLHSPSEQYE